MGDRANIVVSQSKGFVALYTHWGGSEILASLEKGLHVGRVGDEGYLTSTLAQAISGGHGVSETGFGITVNAIEDNEYPILVVDPETHNVYAVDYSPWGGSDLADLALPRAAEVGTQIMENGSYIVEDAVLAELGFAVPVRN